MTILLTGASGFLGRHATTRLLAAGHQVIALGRSAPIASHVRLSWVQCDLNDLGPHTLAWSEVDAVIHLAAAGVKARRRQWAEAIQTNIVGSSRLLTLIGNHATRRPNVFLSGTYYERFVSSNPFFSENPYTVTKAAFSQLARTWSDSYPGAVIFASVFQVYGPGDDPDNVLSYAANCFKNSQVACLGGGTAARDWLYVGDFADAVLSALKPAAPGRFKWDIGSGQLLTLKEMVLTLAELAGVSASLYVFDPARDRPDQMEPIAAAELPPAWRPSTSAREGLAQLLGQS